MQTFGHMLAIMRGAKLAVRNHTGNHAVAAAFARHQAEFLFTGVSTVDVMWAEGEPTLMVVVDGEPALLRDEELKSETLERRIAAITNVERSIVELSGRAVRVDSNVHYMQHRDRAATFN